MIFRIRSASTTGRRGDPASTALVLLFLVFPLGCSKMPDSARERVASSSVRHLPTGDLVGTEGRYGGFAWLGVPYAEPPVGERRFRAPVPVSRWDGTLEATTFGSACPQYADSINTDAPFTKGDIVGSEDCLFLNVYAPKPGRPSSEVNESKSPVMFWIHGGGNTSGTSSFYDGSKLAVDHDVVVVTIDYRLGFLGWFRHRSLRHGAGPLDASGNFGTLDQILALDWVQENIAAFGGDPNDVTIFGESAGAWNVLSLLASPLASGRFHRAIVQSGMTWSFSPAEAENYTDDADPGLSSSSGETIVRLMLAADPAKDRVWAKQAIASMSDDSLSQYLRKASVSDFFEAYRPKGTEVDDGYTCPRVFEDGVVLPAKPLGHAFRNASPFNRVPVILGSNKDEEKIFLLYDREYTSLLFGVIPTPRDRNRYLRDAETITRIWRMMAVDELATDLSRAMPGRVFAYRFDWDEEPSFLWSDLGMLIGASHGFEIPFVFGHWDFGPDTDRLFDETNRPGREGLSSAMMSYWAEFAWQGRPGTGRAGELPEWPAWKPSAPRFAIFDTPEGGGLRLGEGRDTTGAIVATILSDTSYKSLRRRCAALASIFNWAPLVFSVEDYNTVGGGLCRGHPIHELLDPL